MIDNINEWARKHIKDRPISKIEVRKIADELIGKLNGNGVISGDLEIRHYSYLKCLPENLHVAGRLSIQECNALTSLPENLRVDSGLSIQKCNALTSLPENFTVFGYVDICKCNALTSLPENITVVGNLCIQECNTLTSLPENITVVSLSILGCNGLTSLPENLKIHGYLDIYSCNALTSLPENITITGALCIKGCNTLTSLPETFTVVGDLSIRECNALTFLPENLRVSRNLDIYECNALTSLPENIEVGGDLSFVNCPALRSLPNYITSLGRRNDGQTRIVDLTGSGLSQAVIEQLQRTPAPGMQFHFSMAATNAGKKFDTLDKSIQFWAQLAFGTNSDQTYPNLMNPGLLRVQEHNDFSRYLARLTDTAEYKNPNTQKYLAHRVMRLIDLMEKNEHFRETALTEIHRGLASCDDRIIHAFDDLCVMMKTYMAEEALDQGKDPDGTQYKAVMKGFFMLQKVMQAADKAKESLNFVDEIELHLAFQIYLKDKLNLPVDISNMIFRGCAGVTDDQIDKAGEKIRENFKESDFTDYLNEQPAWQRHLRRKNIVPYESLDTIDYSQLPKGTELHCTITEDVAELPVWDTSSKTIYDYNTVEKNHVLRGEHPSNRLPLKWKDMKRVVLPSP